MKRWNYLLQQYLDLRHRLGFKLVEDGLLLPKFVRFIQQQKAPFITTQLALQWATQVSDCHPAHSARRLRAVRHFAQYASGFDTRTEVPAQGLLPHRYLRIQPFLYSDREIAQLLAVAEKLPGPTTFRAATYSTLFGLLVITGMRVGEAMRLQPGDIDYEHGVLVVRYSKNQRTRLIPLHSTTLAKLKQYEELRHQLYPQPQSPNFFLSEQGCRLTHTTVRYWFLHLCRQIGLCHPPGRRGPRIHDLRHRFALATLLHWYRTRVDVEAHLPELATYLGHLHTADTYWYISATPELLRLSTQLLEQRKGGCSL